MRESHFCAYGAWRWPLAAHAWALFRLHKQIRPLRKQTGNPAVVGEAALLRQTMQVHASTIGRKVSNSKIAHRAHVPLLPGKLPPRTQTRA
jgi:hypothetical protein